MEAQEPEAHAYVESVMQDVIPADLPVAPTWDDTIVDQQETHEQSELTELENQAHAERVLLSSDAMRYFTARVPSLEERTGVLESLIVKARVSFPSEDGWVVINLARMETLMEEIKSEKQGEDILDESVTLEKKPEPITSGSLAEAIVTGNVAAAYELMARRPMIALADATADLDALYRFKKGEEVYISELLKTEGARLEEGAIQKAIAALTSALDGTYTDEASAVRMAVLKAVKATAR